MRYDAICVNVQNGHFADRGLYYRGLHKDLVVFVDRFPSRKKGKTAVRMAKSAIISRLHLSKIAITGVLLFAAIAAPNAYAVMLRPQGPSENAIWQQSLRDAVELIDEARGDIDGDGRKETAICYRLPSEMRASLALPGDAGGLVVFAGNERIERPVFHTIFSDAVCEQLELSRGSLAFRSPQPENVQQTTPYRWTYRKDFYFAGDEKTMLSASVAQNPADTVSLLSLQDGRLQTGWSVSEGSTGVGQKLRMRFPVPVRIGLIGVFGGVGSSRTEYRKHNRLHRISIQAKSANQQGAANAKRQMALLEDAPRVSYVVPPLAGVPMSRLEIRVEGVHLGKSVNDTKVGELEIVPIMELRSGVGVAGGYFRTSESIRERGVADVPSQATARGTNQSDAQTPSTAHLFETTNLNALRTLETQLDDSEESFEMDDF